MKTLKLNKKIGTIALCGALATGCIMSTATSAFAADENESGSTKVTIKAIEDSNTDDPAYVWEAPVSIDFEADANGVLHGPKAESVQVKNLSAYPLQIKDISFEASDPWNIVSDADEAAKTSADVLQFNLIADNKTNKSKVAAVDAAAAAVDVSDNTDFYMAAKDNEGANINIGTEGKMLRSTQNLANAKDVGTITWTVKIPR